MLLMTEMPYDPKNFPRYKVQSMNGNNGILNFVQFRCVLTQLPCGSLKLEVKTTETTHCRG